MKTRIHKTALGGFSIEGPYYRRHIGVLGRFLRWVAA